VVSLLFILSTVPARASLPDTTGFGARGVALANGGAAAATDYTATFYNPAGLALSETTSLGLGYTAFSPDLRVNGRSPDIKAARGATFGLAVPFTLPTLLPDWSFGAGLGLFLPDSLLVSVRLKPPSEPRFPALDHRLHRIWITTAVAASYKRKIALGIGTSILADVAGTGADLDLSLDLNQIADPTAQRARARLDVDIKTRVGLVASAWWRPVAALDVALTYRAALAIDNEFRTFARIQTGILNGDVSILFKDVEYYTPHTLTLAAAWRPSSALTLLADVVLSLWGLAPKPVPQVSIAVNLGTPDPTAPLVLQPGDGEFWNTISIRLGVEWAARFSRTITHTLRGGVAYEPTPIPPQRGLLTQIDSDRYAVTVGSGFLLTGFSSIFNEPVSIDWALRLDWVTDRTTTKDDPTIPVPRFTAGGFIVGGAFTTTVRF
jgi:long-chain fatty acid transport protein